MNYEEALKAFKRVPLGRSSVNIKGNVYSKLKALYRTENFTQPNGTVKSMWLCQCDCGNYKSMMYCNLKAGMVKSCGKCKSSEKPVFNITDIEGVVFPNNKGTGNKRHGLTGNPLYQVWVGILNRCYNENLKGYKYYGGKGVTVSREWLTVENFIKDNTDHYKSNLTIDRIDTEGNYEKENVRWITLGEQSANTSPKHWGKVKYKGVCWCNKREVYRVNCYYKKKYHHVGHFDCPKLAALAYDSFVFERKGDLAWLNREHFPEIEYMFNLKEEQ
jgi:hypothetical protein